jgi:hypothetical protein
MDITKNERTLELMLSLLCSALLICIISFPASSFIKNDKNNFNLLFCCLCRVGGDNDTFCDLLYKKKIHGKLHTETGP